MTVHDDPAGVRRATDEGMLLEALAACPVAGPQRETAALPKEERPVPHLP